eukprot:3944063-Prymnesium_polylepis.1
MSGDCHAGERDRGQRAHARFACPSPAEYIHAIPAALHIVASVRALVSQSPATALSRTYVYTSCKRAVLHTPSTRNTHTARGTVCLRRLRVPARVRALFASAAPVDP